MDDIGIPELLIMLGIIIALLGPDRLARAGRALNARIRSLRQASRGDDHPRLQ